MLVRRGRSNRSVELSADAAHVEGVSGAGDGQHGRPEAGDVHPAERPPVCGDLRRGWSAARGVQRRHWSRLDGQHAGDTQRRRQGRLHRIDRGG